MSERTSGSVEFPLTYGISGTFPFALSITRAQHVKGLDVLLYAFSLAIAKGGPGRGQLPSSFRLILGGLETGLNETHRLISLLGISDRVILLKRMNNKKIITLIRQCEFYIQSSRYESFGMTVLEAMSLGRAVLATGVGGLKDICQHKENSWLVPAQNPAGSMS